MMIRSLLYSIYFPIWTAIVCIFFSPLLFARPMVAAKVGKIWATGSIFGMKLFCNITYEIKGMENVLDKPCVFASKHQSAWDTFIFMKLFNAPVYIFKKELLDVPLFGRFFKAMYMIPVDRKGGRSALKRISSQVTDRLEKGHSVVIFPEGTRTEPHTEAKYQPGVALIYKNLEGAVPVIPVALNSGLYWGRRKFLKKAGKITMEFLPPMENGLDTKKFMSELTGKIETRVTELYDE